MARSPAIFHRSPSFRSRPSSISIATISSTKSGLPSAAVGDPLHRRRRASPPAEEVRDQLVAILAAERLEEDDVAFGLPAAPVRACVEQLGPRHADEQDRRVARPLGDVLDEVEEAPAPPSGCRRRRRPAAGWREHLEEPADRPKVSPAQRLRRRQPDELGDPLDDEDRRRRPAEERASFARRSGIVVVVDPRGRCHDLDDRPVRDALPVGEAASAQDERSPSPLARRTPATSRDLPTPAGPSDRDELARALPDGTRSNALAERPSSSSRPTIGESRCARDAGGARRDTCEPVGGDRLGLPLQR